jgi:hypothetical protein
MILPTKEVPASKALITVGGEILEILDESSLNMSGLWLQVSENRDQSSMTRMSFDWFVLALDLLTDERVQSPRRFASLLHVASHRSSLHPR